MKRSTKIALLLSIFIIAGAGAVYYYRLNKVNAAPKPGTLSYYLRLSSIVRNVPIVSPHGSPVYFSTVSDGSKLPSSEVTYTSTETDEKSIVEKTLRYLSEKGFTPAAADLGITQVGGPGRKPLHRASMIKEDEAIAFEIDLLENKQLEVKLKHFE